MTRLFRRLLRGGRRARETIASRRRGGMACGTCGFSGAPLHRAVLWPGLIQAWDLSPDWARWRFVLELLRDAHIPAVATFIARKPS